MTDKELLEVKEIKFHLQNEEHKVKTDEIAADMSLNYYIRNVLKLTGTKYMCLEGGCGSCVVVLEKQDLLTQKSTFLAVNSCLVSILSCHGWRIYTIEGIGGPLTNYHPIQKVLAKFNGTQCGFCSTGMVMNMYSLYNSGKLTMKDVENSFGGNICRCTGYRAILSAFKSLCTDSCPKLLGEYPDIEDIKLCPKTDCSYQSKNEQMSFYHIVRNAKWIKVFSLTDLLGTLEKFKTSSYILVGGNTAKGVYSSFKGPYDLYIDISSVPELEVFEIKNDTLILGANNTLSTTMEYFYKIASQNSKFSYLKDMADHIDLVANVPVRNMATLAGNLMIKHKYNEFPSDIFLILETVGATITITNTRNFKVTLYPKDFLKYDINRHVIQYITLPSLPEDSIFQSYKIMPRAQNVHAIVNAGFLFDIEQKGTLKAIKIIYGNIQPDFIHAKNTEQFLKGRKLFDNSTLQAVFKILDQELNPDARPPDPSPQCRKQLAIALFYKAVLNIAPSSALSPRNKSGGSKLNRPLSSGVQNYETNKSLYPLTQPIPKLEALPQTSGQAQYIMDMSDFHNQLFAAFVTAKAPPQSIVIKIDPRKALAMKDIVAFYSKDDIPGDNTFMPQPLFSVKEEVFCSGVVLYYNQPLGVVVGNNEEVVKQAVELVEVTYKRNNRIPLLTARQILAENAKDRITNNITITPKRKGNDIKHVIKGTFDIYQQYHFHMELQCCNIIPTEDSLEVHASTQWMDLTQVGISKFLKIPANKINVHVRRCGGAFGGKLTRNSLITCAASLPAWKLRQPVKLSMSLPTNMNVIGKRWPLSTNYEVGVDDRGVIQYLEVDHYSDLGSVSNENGLDMLLDLFIRNYDSDTYLIHVNTVKTDTYTNTWTRAPGSTEGLASIESIMEHIAYVTGLDSLEVRKANITKEKELLKYIDDLKVWANIDKRKRDIEKFNKENRWKKKGMAVVPMSYIFEPDGPFSAMVSIYEGDGTVSISHGGIEMGQGINTKVAQVCAYKFGIPLENVSVLPSNSFIGANCVNSGGSITSEAISYAVIEACDKLLETLKPYRDQMKNLTWFEVVQKCYQEKKLLSAIGCYSPKSPNVSPYIIYGIVATEVLLDVLTGQSLITRVDLIEDTGESMSPEIDIGQVEGAFVMGMGYYLTEQIIYDEFEGKILTNNTWTYHPPGVKDIPVDFRVKFPKSTNPLGVLNSKATAEPPLCLSICVPLAIRNAVASARSDADESKPKWYPIDGTTTVENVILNSLHDYRQYLL